MSETAGDYDLRAKCIDDWFAVSPILDRCIDAAAVAQQSFSDAYPGWQIYSRIIRGDEVFDRQLQAWAILMARAVSRARKLNGRQFVGPRGRSPHWVAVAGCDALDHLLFRKYAISAGARAALLGCDNEAYSRLRDTVAACMHEGFDNYVGELHRAYRIVRRWERDA